MESIADLFKVVTPCVRHTENTRTIVRTPKNKFAVVLKPVDLKKELAIWYHFQFKMKTIVTK